MTLSVALSCIAVLLALAPFAVVIGRQKIATPLIYGVCAASR